MRKVWVAICLLLVSTVAFAQPDPAKEESWEQVVPGLFQRETPQGELEHFLVGKKGAQLVLAGLRAQIDELLREYLLKTTTQEEVEAHMRAISFLERRLALKSAIYGPACAPRTVPATQWASFYAGTNCTGQEYDVDNFGTWDGNGCSDSVDFTDPPYNCSALTLPENVSSYKIPNGTCYNCPDEGPAYYKGECDSGSDGMPVYRGLECCEDGDCSSGDLCCYGKCWDVECCWDGDCSGSEQCNSSGCCWTCEGKECGDDGCGGSCGSCGSGESCVGGQCQEDVTCDPTCNGRSCSSNSDCDNDPCPQGECFRGECLCVT